MKTPGEVLAAQVAKLKESDVFSVRSGNLPTWCPGCGYFGIHQGLNNAIQRLKLPHHMEVTVSAICLATLLVWVPAAQAATRFLPTPTACIPFMVGPSRSPPV